MNTTRFVSVSAIILVGWLGATFLNDVPSKRYPKLDRVSSTASLDQNLQPDLTSPQPISHEMPRSASR